jgi:predicted dehydrogenase
VVRRPAVIEEGVMPRVDVEERSFDPGDALLAEIEAFLDAVGQGRPPLVSGEDGLRALQTATRIAELVGRGQVTV